MPRPSDKIPRYKELIIQAYPEVHEKVADIVRKTVPRGSTILDLASGQGALSQRLMDIGYDLCCTSWNDRLKITPRRVFRLNLDQEFGVEQVGGVPYRCVVAVEIIEHLRNPFQFLASVRNLLGDEGILVLTTPNIESTLSRLQTLLRGSPLSFSDEEITKNRHIFMPNRAILELFFRQVGLEIIERHFWPEEESAVSGPRTLAKKLLAAIVNAVGRGDLRGATRIYVARKTAPAPENQQDLY
jgi:2-polyprenyl-3-methyl-5-hydroxy-6-metoxy-1,4-benzoquinol methylase